MTYTRRNTRRSVCPSPYPVFPGPRRRRRIVCCIHTHIHTYIHTRLDARVSSRHRPAGVWLGLLRRLCRPGRAGWMVTLSFSLTESAARSITIILILFEGSILGPSTVHPRHPRHPRFQVSSTVCDPGSQSSERSLNCCCGVHVQKGAFVIDQRQAVSIGISKVATTVVIIPHPPPPSTHRAIDRPRNTTTIYLSTIFCSSSTLHLACYRQIRLRVGCQIAIPEMAKALGQDRPSS